MGLASPTAPPCCGRCCPGTKQGSNPQLRGCIDSGYRRASVGGRERTWIRAVVDGITLEYEASGTGDAVVFIHGAFIADAFKPLVAEPSLADHYRLITYHRRGYMGSSRTPGPISVGHQAADCRGLMRYLGLEQVHVVGHSAGGAMALQFALDYPEVVHSLALLEPALMVGDSARVYRDSLQQGQRRYREAGAEVVADEFLKARWPGYRSAMDQMLPGGFDQAVAAASATFDLDMGLLDWQFDSVEAQRIPHPTLVVVGGGSVVLSPRFEETQRFLLSHIPSAEGFVLPDATHFLHLETPEAAKAMAEGLADFYTRRPYAP